MTIKLNTYYVIPLLLLFFAISFFGIGMFISRCTLKEKCNKCNNCKEKNIHDIFSAFTKKDMAYWFVILLFFIIFWVSSYLYNDTDLVSYIGFSGTIVSIFLGIIAIIYSYFQTSDNAYTQKELSKTLDELNKASTNITTSVDKFSSLESKVLSLSADLKNTLDIINVMREDLKDNFEKTNKNIESVIQTHTINSSSSVSDWDDILF
ncbi:Uncharacterised protein [[Clostridium] sordellii]|uniref:hypothetical protein n=1 Tax=Paraclostridium sordellii TaxID=1505 RepID=UPI0005E9D837|nr:hypothetical protein [Paeniclostridium sordellii]CEO04823.1 Uncharacterised protein [[Clostridium] sordellii] [Paeniclostridium sordellii]